MNLFSPYHLIYDTYVALDDFYYFGADILVHVVGDGKAVVTIFAEFHRGIYCLKETLLVDAGNDEVAFVDGLWAFRTGADADGWEGMAYTGEEAAFFGKGTAVANYSKGIHLKAVVVVET